MGDGLNALLGMDIGALRRVAEECGMPRYAARQMSDWMYGKRVLTIDGMTNLSKRSRAALSERYELGARPYADVRVSRDGTRKYLFPARCGGYAETVFIPEGKRATLCVSSQVGCKMGCVFCLTGRQGFGGQLTVCDILNQVVSVPESGRITNIVFMGQGEPMDNYGQVLAAIRILTSEEGFAMSPKRITVSTAGVLPALERLCEESRCNIAVSLHSPFHLERMEMMPVEKACPASAVVEALKRREEFRDCRGGRPRATSRQRRLSFEYVLLKGRNDTLSHAVSVASLLRGLDCRVNVIPFNGYEGAGFAPPSAGDAATFCGYLKRRGVNATVRKARGADISAACGMLVAEAQGGGTLKQ